MCPTKRLLAGTLVVTLSFISSVLFVSKVYAEESMYFVVTAYYSPLPGQSRYATWSYEWDIRLNGSWVNTASGKQVFPGLIAAPSNYPFGTKIYFKWYGIGEVADRGWAIVKAWERWYNHDRIDIWLWHGDAWLDRALRWGKRTVKWKIVIPSSEITLNFPETTWVAYESLRVAPDSSETQVQLLQQLLKDIDTYSWEIDGNFDSMREVFINFQLEKGIIASQNDVWAGYFWPRTIAVIRDILPQDLRILVEEPEENFYNYNHHRASELYKTVLEYGDLQITPESGEEDVRLLQELLIELWEYNGPIDGIYETIKNPLIDFQIKIWLIEDSDDWGAGYFWNRTKTVLWSYYEGEEFLGAKKYQTQAVRLSQAMEKQIESIFPRIVGILESRARRNNQSTQVQLQEFQSRMVKMISQIQDPYILARLDFLIALIDLELTEL